MPAHDNVELDARQRGIVELVSHECLSNKARGGRKARGVVVAFEIVVDGLWNMEGPQVVSVLSRHLVYDARGIRAVVAANVKEVSDVVFGESIEDLLAIGFVGFVATAPQTGRRRVGDPI